jgi:hypothetical protein
MGDLGEVVAPVVRYVEIKPGYRVGDDGSVWSCVIGGCKPRVGDTWHRLKPYPGPKGHLYVTVGLHDRRYVHHLVLEAFVGPCPPGLECRHFPDRDPANNRLENIHWGTPEENAADKIFHGTDLKGEEQNGAILTEADVLDALARYRAGEPIVTIARRLGVTDNAIGKIFRGENWRHVTDVTGLPPAPGQVKGERNGRSILTEATVLEALARHKAGESTKEIAERLGVVERTIWQVLAGRTWSSFTGLEPTSLKPFARR